MRLIYKSCTHCSTPTPPINLFNGECVNCIVKYAIYKIDICRWDFDVNCKVEEFKDPLDSLGGYVFDKKELLL